MAIRLLFFATQILATLALDFKYGSDTSPLQCVSKVKVCDSDCVSAIHQICKGDVRKVPRKTIQVGNCKASWYNPYTGPQSQRPSGFEAPELPDEATCNKIYHLALQKKVAGGDRDCSPNRYLGGTTLIYSSSDKDPESAYVARLEPPDMQPCCYSQKDCDSTKVFGQEVSCSRSNHSVRTRRDLGPSGLGVSTLDKVCVGTTLTFSATWAACATSALVAALAFAVLNPVANAITGFLCVAGLALVPTSIITCAIDSYINYGWKRAVLTISGPTPEIKAKNFCSSLDDRQPSCVEAALIKACKSNGGTLNMNEPYSSTS